ncbi:P123 protein [Arthrobotrys entomopaga]|nr:P123 protein [Arthrobotrys entomopaga]
MSSSKRQLITLDKMPSLTALYEKGTLDASIGAPARVSPNKTFNDAILLIQADMTKLQVDAIVNAANKSLLGGGGIDGAIHRAAGEQLYHECLTLNGCETGQAKITQAYKLPAKHVIHTVGPIYWEHKDVGRDPAKLLKDCYVNSLDVARRNGCKNIAFCCISTGIYGYPNTQAADVACETVRMYLVKQAEEESEAKSNELFGDDPSLEEISGGVKIDEEGNQERGEKKAEKEEGKKEVGEKKEEEATQSAAIQGEQVEVSENVVGEPETKESSVPKDDTEKENLPAQEPEFKSKIEKVIFCLFMDKDVSAYHDILPAWFPPTEDVEGALDKLKRTKSSIENTQSVEEAGESDDDNGVKEAVERFRKKIAER